MHETNIFLRKSTNCVRAQTLVNTNEMLVNTKSVPRLPCRHTWERPIYLPIYNKVEISPIYNKV